MQPGGADTRLINASDSPAAATPARTAATATNAVNMANVATAAGLVPLLARLADVPVAAPTASLAELLGGWLGWTDAIALSSALKAGATPAAPRSAGKARVRSAAGAGAGPAAAAVSAQVAAQVAAHPGAAPPAHALLQADYLRLRRALTQAIAADPAVTAQVDGLLLMSPKPGAPLESPLDHAPYRRHHQALQRQMDDTLGPLRVRLRAALAAGSAAQARLAALDAVLDNSLGARERPLLAQVPALLERRFRQLQQQALAANAEPDADAAPGPAPAAKPAAPHAAAMPIPGPWLARYGQDLQAVLLAELDLRCQPLQGLLQALRSPAPDPTLAVTPAAAAAAPPLSTPAAPVAAAG